MSLRVLHVIPSVSPTQGGPSFALPLFTSAIAQQGATVTVATTDDDRPGSRLDVPLNEFVPGKGGATYIYFRKNAEFYKISRALGRWLRRHAGEYDVVHIHALFSFASFAAARAAQRAGIPYIVRPLGVLDQWGLQNRRRFVKRWSLRIIELPIWRGAAAIHYTAEAERTEAAAAHPDIASLRSHIIPIPVEPARVTVETEIRKRFPNTAGRRVILFLSRLHKKKGLELLLSAFQQVHSEFPDTLLVIAGNGDAGYIESLRQKAAALGCDRDVFWAGFLAGADKYALLAGATMFVLPSFSENFGMAAAEALAAGTPSILSDKVAIAREAGDENAAIVVPCDARAIAAAARRLLNDDELRAQLRERARIWIAERFSSETIGRELCALYASCLDD